MSVIVVSVMHLDLWRASSSATRSAEFGVHRGQHLWELSTSVTVRPRVLQRFGHLQADVAGADDERRLRRAGEAVGEREGVGHGVQQVDAVGGAELIEAGDRRADRDRAGADDELRRSGASRCGRPAR